MSNAYARAGVDLAAGDKAVELMKADVAATHTSSSIAKVMAGVGGFAGLIDATALTSYRRPLLAMSTDGVGTKVELAAQLGVYDTIGQDMVAMVVDDIAVVGATPLALTDYIACGKVYPERIAAIVSGIARGCILAATPLVGGETAEHPGTLAPDQFDVAGAAVGVVEADEMLSPERVRSGDVLLAMASSGLHSNGYSLVRRILADTGWSLDRQVPELGRELGAELLEPTRIYTAACLDMVRQLGQGVRIFSHVTGGGIPANLARVIPTGLVGVVERQSWQLPAIVELLAAAGDLTTEDLEDTWNAGVGMIAVLAPDVVDEAAALARAAGFQAWDMGRVLSASDDVPAGREVSGTKGVSAGRVVMAGDYRRSS